MMVPLFLLLLPLSHCAPSFHSHTFPHPCDTTICRVSDKSLDSALSVFLCFTKEKISAMEEKDKKRELAVAIAPYLVREEFREEELAAMDSEAVVTLVNLVLHEGSDKVLKKTRRLHFEDLVKSVGKANNLEMNLKFYDPILLALINCQAKTIAEIHQLVDPRVGEDRAGRGVFVNEITDTIKRKIQGLMSVPEFDKILPGLPGNGMAKPTLPILDKLSMTAWEDLSTPQYLALPAHEKHQIIWDKCLEDTSSAPWFSSPQVHFFTQHMCPVLRTVGDMQPWEEGLLVDGWRNKYIHTVGVVGKVEWKNLGGHDYTGVFEGSSFGIVRFSLASEPSSSDLNTRPGMGLKFLRSGMDSANIVAKYSFEGQESWNFFKNNLTTHIPLPPLGPSLEVVKTFGVNPIRLSEASPYVGSAGLSDCSFYGEDGKAVANPVFPYGLRFHPTGDISFSDTYVRPVNEDLVTIPSGSTLYQVWARDQPVEMGGAEAHISDLVLRSEMTTSLWGDKHLFFRHQDMWDDIDLFPEWSDYTPFFGHGLKRCPFN